MAYKLALPSDCLLHPVFHVSSLKKHLGAQVIPIPTLPPMDSGGFVHPEPVVVLQTKAKQLRSRSITEVLVQWQGQDPIHATWECLYA